MLENIITSILSGGFAGIIISLITKTYFVEKIKQSIKSRYDEKIENLKGQINLNNSIIEKSVNSFDYINNLTQEKRIEAATVFWQNFLVIKELISTIIKFDDILLENEFNDYFTPSWNGNQIVPHYFKKLKDSDALNQLNEIEKKIENLRPFLNEALWINFLFYKIFYGRVIYIYSIGSEDYKTKYWKNDKALIDLLKKSVSVEEYDNIISKKMGSLSLIQNLVEQNVLNEINKILIGHSASIETYKKAIEINNLLLYQNNEKK